MISPSVLKSAVAFATVVAICGASQVQPRGSQKPRLAQMRRVHTATAAREGQEARVPLRLVNGLPAVELTVNGRGPFLFAIDTGQSFAVSVSPDFMDRMALRKTGETLVGDPSGRASRSIATFRMKTLVLKGIAFRNVEGSAAAMGPSRGNAVAGTIGMALFAGLMPTIDYGHAFFWVRPGELPRPNGKDVVAASIDEMGLIRIPLTVGDRIVTVHLDTGNARNALIMPTNMIASLPTRGEPRAIGVAHTISQTVKIEAVDLVGRVAVGSTPLSVTAVAFPSVAPVGDLGSPGLQRTAVTIDMLHRRVRVVPSE